MFDTIIRGASIVDGTGSPRFETDLAIKDGCIAQIGPIPPEAAAARTIDAAGLAVCPGFIDIHTHADIALLARPAHLPKIMQGVTTEVFTNCGLGFAPITDSGMAIQRQYIAGLFGDDGSQAKAPRSSKGSPAGDKESAITDESQADDRQGSFAEREPRNQADWQWRTVAEFLAQFEAQGIGANIAYLIPHGAVRVSAMGMLERPADSEEIRRMQAMIAQGMEEGAWGVSTGIWYAPMRSAARDELTTLFRAGGLFATHQRDYGDSILAATEESLAIAREAGVPVQISHLQMNGPGNKDRAPELLALLERAQRDGVDITCDTYPYTAGSTFVQSLLPPWMVDGGPEAILQRLSEPDTRARVVEELRGARSETEWQSYNLVGAQSPHNRSLEGLDFSAAAKARGLTVPVWICALLEEEDLRACFVHHAAHEGNVRTILQWPGQMVGSDGLHLPGKTHPRLYGTFPRVLGRYVREEKVLTLEQAVHKMTGMPASRLGLKQRGLLQKGYAADLVLVDPRTVADTATFDDPLQYPTGVPYVFVNGVAVKERDNPTYALAGQVLRRI